jgi:hypothetical protein
MDTHLEIQALPHPDPRIRRLGFDLTHPYVEQCWGAVLGPSGVALLRRMPTLWAEHEPARFPTAELGATLGLTGGTGDQSRFARTLERLTYFDLGAWTDQGSVLSIYTEVAPLTEQRVDRLPEWTRRAHGRLLGEHLDGIASRNDRSSAVADITSRLDRLQQPRTSHQPPSTALGR